MRLKRPLQLFIAASLTTAVGMPLALAQHHEERHEEHHEAQHEEHRDERHYAPRPEPPRYVGHQPGYHPPHPVVVHRNPVRVMAPKVIRWGAHPWRHWEHPEFARPVYYWNWGEVHNVSCTAEDSDGDQYPVSVSTWSGFGLQNMSSVEDDALDRCYAETQGDQSCYVATCTHY
ncbi:MAG TPA: hypothetical protein VN947_10020 [Polyangia bacterium]|nr:hypothetical protein [Polyangia bacterium]